MHDKVSRSPILSVHDLTVGINRSTGNFLALDNLSFEVSPGETFALVGQSASGKTMTALALLGLLPKHANPISGTFFYKETDYNFNSPKSFAHFRGNEIAIIFQEPKSALNPLMKIGNQFCDIIKANQMVQTNMARDIAKKLINDVGFKESEPIYNSFPHQLSGGMAQRILIAMALSCNPSIIIADEITTALDVSTQIQILKLIKDIQEKINFSLILISHDLNLVSKLSDTICVLSNGKLVEYGITSEIIANPQKSETKALLKGKK